MWYYDKKLQYPVNIKKGDLNMAKCMAAQLGGPDGELSASLRYLSPVSYTHLFSGGWLVCG